MDAIENSAYQSEGVDEPVVAIVGDATTPEFYAQVKIEKWANESNFSLRYDEPVLDHTVDADGVVEARHEGATSRIYATKASTVEPVTAIRRVFSGDVLTALEATAEYELFDRAVSPGTAILSHYQVSETVVALLDLMPASMHIEVDADGNAVDFDYADKPYHPGDVDIPSCGPTKVVRYRTPYTRVANPMFIDAGVEIIMMRWHGSQADLLDSLLDAVEATLQAHGVETMRHDSRAKVYFKHGDRWVKCFSVQAAEGGLYGYFNVASAYNKIYDFYRPDVVKDVRDLYAYGVQVAHPEITHSIVDEIMVAFAANAGLPIVDEALTSSEIVQWQEIQELQDCISWACDGERQDANWYPLVARDGIEFEVVLPSQPTTNLVPFTGNAPKNAAAFVQAPLGYLEMVETNDWRVADVAGSLAIYHADRAHNDYKTGKVAHIYRPIAHDAAGRSVFCDFVELDGLADGSEYDLTQGLTVRVPQAWLDAATYPVVVDPTLGYSTAGASTASARNILLGTVVQPSQTGWLHAMNCYFASSNATNVSVEYALYDAQGSFNLQVQTGENTSPQTAGWRPLLSEKPWHVTSGRDYILAVWSTGTGTYVPTEPDIYYDSTSGKTSYTLSSTYATSTWPSTLTGATTQSNRQYSIYAHVGYPFPLMGVSTNSMPATTAARYLQIQPEVASAWNATQNGVESILSSACSVGDFAFTLATAPGAGITRQWTVHRNAVATSLLAATTNGTSSSNSIDAAFGVANDRWSFAMTTAGGTPAASALNRFRLQMVCDSQPLFSRISTSTTANRFAGVQDDAAQTSAATAEQVMPESGTLKTFRARLADTLTAGSFTLTLVKNGTDTAAVITLDSTNQEAGYTATNITVATGDRLYWRCVPSTPTAPSAARTINICSLYDSDTAGNGILLQGNNVAVSNTVTNYNRWYTTGAWNATESNTQALALPVQFTKLYVLLSAAPSTSRSRLVGLRVNGATSDAQVTISGTATTGTWTGTVNVNRDDLLSVIHTPTGTPTASNVKYGLVFNHGTTWVADPIFM